MEDDDFYDDEANDMPFDMDSVCSTCRCHLHTVTDYVYGICDECRRYAEAEQRKDA